MSSLKQVIGKLTFNSPIVVAAGPLTDRVELIKEAEENGAGAVSTKLTLLEQPIQGYRKMHAVRGLYNFNPSDKRNSLEDGLSLVRQVKKETSLPIFTNIAGPGDHYEGWIKIAQMMEEAGADAIELNFVCPNMTFSKQADGKIAGALVGKRPDIMRNIVSEVKKSVSIPVWAKATANNVDYLVSAKAIAEAGADGIVTNGTQIAVPPIDIYNGGKTSMNNLMNNAIGGCVGPVNRLYSNRLVANAATGTDLIIAGGGGITEWQHVVETIMFGATLTTMCTKLLWDGFGVIKRINEQLLQFMEEQGYESISDMRGLALKHLVAPDKLETIDALPEIDAGKCVGCGVCTKIGSCTALFVNDRKKAEVIPEKCARCGLCGCLCPKKAISFPTAQ